MSELTQEQIAKIDKLHNIVFNAMRDLLGDEAIAWDMEWIGEISDTMSKIAVNHFGREMMEIYPYIDREKK